jgi:hypothetical protein
LGERQENDLRRHLDAEEEDGRAPQPVLTPQDEAELLALLPLLDRAHLTKPVIRSVPRDLDRP